jgi:hypothetical protein
MNANRHASLRHALAIGGTASTAVTTIMLMLRRTVRYASFLLTSLLTTAFGMTMQ